MAQQVESTGVIGLGAMGYQMARHMKDRGFRVYGYDIASDACEQAAEIAVDICATPAEVGEKADVVLVMVANDAQIKDVIVDSGLLEQLTANAVICIASSCSMATCHAMERHCRERGVGLLDTPVVLGQQAANEGQLTTFVGGEEAAFVKARPVLGAFSGQVIHVGESGMGQLTKTVNNMLLWACISANYEALSFAKKAGADIPRLVDALQHSSGANWSLSRWGKSTGKWAEKDMDVALELAQSIQQPVPLAALVDQLMKGMNQDKMKALLD